MFTHHCRPFKRVTSVAFSPDGLLASLSEDKVIIRDLSGRIIRSFAYKDSESFLASLTDEEIIFRSYIKKIFYDLPAEPASSGLIINDNYTIVNDCFKNLAWKPDNLLAITSTDSFFLWDIKKNKKLRFRRSNNLYFSMNLNFGPHNLLAFWNEAYALLLRYDRDRRRLLESLNKLGSNSEEEEDSK